MATEDGMDLDPVPSLRDDAEDDDDDDDEEEEEEDKNSVTALVDRLRQIVRQRLGTVDDVTIVGAVPATKATASTDKGTGGSNVMVASARAMAQLNLSTFDGEEGPGAARHAFQTTLGKLKELVIQPFTKTTAGLDGRNLGRLADQLSRYGDTTSRLDLLRKKAQALRDFAKVEQDERKLALDAKFGAKSLCLPSRIFRLATSLGFGVANELEEESKVYLTYDVYLFLEISYAGPEVTLAVTLTNEDGVESSLVDEARDILASFQLEDKDRGLEILHDKLRALVRRSDLEIALKAGSLNELTKNAENVMRAGEDGSTVQRVSRGIELRLPALYVSTGFLRRGKDVWSTSADRPSAADDSLIVKQGMHDQQRVIVSLTFRYDKGAPKHEDIADWKEKTALMLTIEPPVEMSASTCAEVTAFSSLVPTPADPAHASPPPGPTEAEGNALALLLSKIGQEPIRSDALCRPPSMNVTATFQMAPEEAMTVLRFAINASVSVAQGEATPVKDTSPASLATILHHVALRPDQEAQIPKIVQKIRQQVCFNALLASLVHRETMAFERPKPKPEAKENMEVEGAEVSPQLAPSQDSRNTRKRRIIMCQERREHLLKFKKLDGKGELAAQGGMEEALLGTSASNLTTSDSVSQEVDLTVKVLPPRQIVIEQGSETLLTINVNAEGGIDVPEKQDLVAFLERSSSVPMAVFRLLQAKKELS